MRPRADDPSLDRYAGGSFQLGSGVGVQCGRPFGAVVGPAFKGLLAFFADLLGSDPSLDFGVGNVGWEVAGEPLANVGRGLEQVARLLPGGRRGEGRSRRGAAVGGGGRGAAVGGGPGEGESSAVQAGRGRAGETSGSGVSDVVNRGRRALAG